MGRGSYCVLWSSKIPEIHGIVERISESEERREFLGSMKEVEPLKGGLFRSMRLLITLSRISYDISLLPERQNRIQFMDR